MVDVLIRDLPPETVAAIDAEAKRLGLSRNEYLRRRLAQDARLPGSRVTREDFARLADLASDLLDPEVMRDAWR